MWRELVRNFSSFQIMVRLPSLTSFVRSIFSVICWFVRGFLFLWGFKIEMSFNDNKKRKKKVAIKTSSVLTVFCLWNCIDMRCTITC